jgi:hypothetical protein
VSLSSATLCIGQNFKVQSKDITRGLKESVRIVDISRISGDF